MRGGYGCAPEPDLNRTFIVRSAADPHIEAMTRLLAAAAALALAGSFAAAGAHGSDDDDHGRGDHERARAALEAGEIAPLREILERAQADFPGTLLEVELEREDGRWLYEIELLAPGGRVLELFYDARTAELLHARGHGLERAWREEETEGHGR
jgi:uncharacterized membrane protein YkoI